jgi:hypothetical protein
MAEPFFYDPYNIDRYPDVYFTTTPNVEKDISFKLRHRRQTHYSPDRVTEILAQPDGYTGGDVFDQTISQSGLLSDFGIRETSWGKSISRHESQQPWNYSYSESPYTHVSTAYDYDPESPICAKRQAYEGPFYRQGDNPTCTVWAGVHALKTCDVELDPEVIAKLLNRALPKNKTDRGGLDFITMASVLADCHSTSVVADLGVDRPKLMQFGRPQSSIGRIVRNAVDDGGALMVSVAAKSNENGPGRHAICVTGYDVTSEGQTNVQVIDSAFGAGALSLEGLTEEVQNSNSWAGLLTITPKG